MQQTECPDEVVVIGGGFVGLHTAVLAGLSSVKKITIVDINKDVVERINKNNIHIKEDFIINNWSLVKDKIFATTSYDRVKDKEVYIISVQTPLSRMGIDFSPLENVVKKLSNIISDDTLIVSEVTIYPGGTEELIARPLEKLSGLKLEEKLFVAHVPERIDSGRKEWPPNKLPRVLGGIGINSLNKAKKLYEKCFGVPLHVVNDIKVAEFSKLLENSFRLVNISFINELKRYADRIGIDMNKVIEAASTKPFGFMKFYPSAYAGGACLPKDAFMLEMISDSSLLAIARYVNKSQPVYYAWKLRNEIMKKIARANDFGRLVVLFYGAGYKPGSYLKVESPVLKIVDELKKLEPEWKIIVYDPKIEEYSNLDERETIATADVIVTWGYSLAKHVNILNNKLIIDLKSL